MGINWRQRAPVVRLLVAVYAELGEEAFKGHYGPIAKLYGHGATYDAIKSFFAKEIVRMAEELKAAARSLDGNGGKEGREVVLAGAHRSGMIRRMQPLHIDLEDNTEDEIVITGEREVRMPMHGEKESCQLVETGIEERACSESVHNVQGSRLPNHTPKRINPPASKARHILSATPGPSSRPRRHNRTPLKAMHRQQPAPSRKRPYSVLLDSDEMIPPSFSYVTTHGRHRCALCMTEFPNAAVLEKHEMISKLHLANLKDPVVVSKGCMALAQGMSLVERTIPKRQQVDPAPPSKIWWSTGWNEALGQQPDLERESSTRSARVGSVVVENENDGSPDATQSAHSPHNREMAPTGGQAMVRPATHSRDGETGPLPDAEPVQHPAVDKGNQRPRTAPVDDHSGMSIAVNHQSNTGPENPNPQYQVLTEVIPDHSGSNTIAEYVSPTLLAQMLLSSGMELLAKKCIEEHPELATGFYKRMRTMKGATGYRVAETREQARENMAE